MLTTKLPKNNQITKAAAPRKYSCETSTTSIKQVSVSPSKVRSFTTLPTMQLRLMRTYWPRKWDPVLSPAHADRTSLDMCLIKIGTKTSRQESNYCARRMSL